MWQKGMGEIGRFPFGFPSDTRPAPRRNSLLVVLVPEAVPLPILEGPWRSRKKTQQNENKATVLRGFLGPHKGVHGKCAAGILFHTSKRRLVLEETPGCIFASFFHS